MQEKEITVYKESLKDCVVYQFDQFRPLERLISEYDEDVSEIFRFILETVEKNLNEIFEHEEKRIGHTTFTREVGTMKIISAERARFASDKV